MRLGVRMIPESYDSEAMLTYDLAYHLGLQHGAERALALIWEQIGNGQGAIDAATVAGQQVDQWLELKQAELDASMVVH